MLVPDIQTVIRKFAVAGLACSACGCAFAPSKDATEYLKLTTSCGTPRVAASSTYTVLPVNVEISLNSVAGTSTDSRLTAEASALMIRSVHDYLQAAWKLRPTEQPQPEAKWLAVTGRMDPAYWYARRLLPPCGQPLVPVPGRAIESTDGDVTFWLQARSVETTGGLAALIVGFTILTSGRAMGSGQLEERIISEKLDSAYLLVGMANAQTGEILWINTLLIQESDNLRNPADVSRLVREAFEGK